MITLKIPRCELLFLFLTVTCTSLTAQQRDVSYSGSALPLKYQTETMHLRFSTYVKDNQVYQIGIVGERMKHEMMISPDAMIVFRKYQKQRRWLLVCSSVQLAAEVVAFTSKNKSRRTGLLIGAGAVSLVSIPLYIGSQNNLNTAVWIRNRDVLK